MDKDRIKGAANQAKGVVKEVAGKVTGDAKLESEGKADKVAGKVQNAIGGDQGYRSRQVTMARVVFHVVNQHQLARSRMVAAPASALTTVLFGIIVVTALYFGREVLVPIALAVLMSFVLAPLVRLLQRIYVPRALAVFVSVLVAFAAVFSLAAMMVSQVNQLASDLPGYQSTLQSKIQSVRGVAGGTGTLERASEVLQSLGRELDKPKLSAPSLQRSSTSEYADTR